MEIKLKTPNLEEGGYWDFAEQVSTFFQVMRNPSILSPLEVRKAKRWLLSLVVIPDGEDEKKYMRKIEQEIQKYSFNDLIDLVSWKEAEPDPK